ncbi:MAG: rhomboid family intramembrane serine protease [Euryarchaeota archaeon]|nr:rhomboid family intramembrane serine protease [Euryarchaeota archaeon]
MAQCDRCGAHENMPYRCHRCGGTFCGQHRLPEKHDCPGLQEWRDPDGIFDSGFDDSVNNPGRQERTMADRVPFNTSTGGPFGYFRNNMTYVFLALMWVTFLLQCLAFTIFGPAVHNALFTLDPNNVEYVWTWITSIFAHSPGNFFHIVFNSIVLYFFGPIVERKTGSRAFTALFLASGAIAGLAQIGAGTLFGLFGLGIAGPANPVLGASGAIMAIMGVLTVLNPQLRVLLFFFIPMPLWLLTLGFAVVSVGLVGFGGVGAGGVAHLAHLAGLFIGLGYGEKLRREGERAPDQLRFGGGGPGGPGGGMGPGRGRF